jgi:hypothetical protein
MLTGDRFRAADFLHDLTLYPKMSKVVCLSSYSPGILRLSGKVSASLRWVLNWLQFSDDTFVGFASGEFCNSNCTGYSDNA